MIQEKRTQVIYYYLSDVGEDGVLESQSVLITNNYGVLVIDL